MAANDNIMGAPTEGLGQNVTFAFATGGGPPQLQVGGPSQVNADLRGGGPKNTTTVSGIQPLEQDTTLSLLMKLGGDVLEGQVKKAQTANYVKGMTAVMQGKAIEDVVADMPWYERAFGSADMVEGARAYNAQARSQEVALGLEDRMGELRMMSPTDATKVFTDAVQGSLTGDEATDTALLMEHAKAMPGVIRRHLKEHYLYQQEQADQAQSEAIFSSGSALQSIASARTTNAEELATAQAQFVQNILPPLGQPDDNFFKRITRIGIALATEGKLHPINALKQQAFFDVLPAEYKAQLNRAVEAGESRLKQNYSQDYADEVFEVSVKSKYPDPGWTPKMTGDLMRKKNSEFNKMTGSDRGYFSTGEIVAAERGTLDAIMAERIKQARLLAKAAEATNKADEKALAAEQEQNFIKESIQNGTHGQLVQTKGYSREDIDAVAMPIYETLATPQQRAQWLYHGYRQDNATFKRIASRLDGSVTTAMGVAEKDPNAITAAYEQWKELQTLNPNMAASYYPENHAFMLAFDRSLSVDRAPPFIAFKAAMDKKSWQPVDKATMKAATQAVADRFNSGVIGRTFGGYKLTDSSMRTVTQSVARLAEELAPVTTTPAEAAETATQRAVDNGDIEVVGRHAWANTDPKAKDNRLMTWLRTSKGDHVALDEDNAVDMFDRAVEAAFVKPGSSGALADDIEDQQQTWLWRLPDRNGVPQIFARRLVNGVPVDALVTGDDVIKHALKAKKQPTNWAFGPKPAPGTFMADPPKGQPSIYASEEEWAAYRKQGK